MPITKKAAPWGGALIAFVLVLACVWLWPRLLEAAMDGQRYYHNQLTHAFAAIQTAPGWQPTAILVFIGFAYGALHAIGPGHGKVVVAGYLLASRSCLRRAMMITFLASIMQALVAIGLVYGLVVLWGYTRAEAQSWATQMESASLGLVALIGAALVYRGLWGIVRLIHPSQAKEAVCTCGCSGHAPDSQTLAQQGGWGATALMVLSIGMRPCSGALLLLVFASLMGLYGAGAWAVFAMGLGTALTTSLIALATVLLRDRMTALMDRGTQALAWGQAGLCLAAGVFIMMMGAAFLWSGFGASWGAGAAFQQASDPMQGGVSHPLMKGFYR